MILEARMRGEAVRIVSLAHQIEVMARQKKFRDIEYYLKPLRKPQRRRRVDQSEAVAAMLDRRIAKQQVEPTAGPANPRKD